MKQAVLNRAIKRLVVEVLALEITPDELPDDEILWGDAGLLDSISGLRLISALEHTFKLEIGDDELTLELFASVDSIAAFIKNKLM